MTAEDYLIFETPGGGGFGPPTDRDEEAMELDIRRELVSSDRARTDYGVNL